MTSTHGGRRAGAGRKPLPPEQVTLPVTVRLKRAEIERLKELGGGNVAKAIRLLLKEAAK